jgi:hypothetical protein
VEVEEIRFASGLIGKSERRSAARDPEGNEEDREEYGSGSDGGVCKEVEERMVYAKG